MTDVRRMVANVLASVIWIVLFSISMIISPVPIGLAVIFFEESEPEAYIKACVGILLLGLSILQFFLIALPVLDILELLHLSFNETDYSHGDQSCSYVFPTCSQDRILGFILQTADLTSDMVVYTGSWLFFSICLSYEILRFSLRLPNYFESDRSISLSDITPLQQYVLVNTLESLQPIRSVVANIWIQACSLCHLPYIIYDTIISKARKIIQQEIRQELATLTAFVDDLLSKQIRQKLEGFAAVISGPINEHLQQQLQPFTTTLETYRQEVHQQKEQLKRAARTIRVLEQRVAFQDQLAQSRNAELQKLSTRVESQEKAKVMADEQLLEKCQDHVTDRLGLYLRWISAIQDEVEKLQTASAHNGQSQSSSSRSRVLSIKTTPEPLSASSQTSFQSLNGTKPLLRDLDFKATGSKKHCPEPIIGKAESHFDSHVEIASEDVVEPGTFDPDVDWSVHEKFAAQASPVHREFLSVQNASGQPPRRPRVNGRKLATGHVQDWQELIRNVILNYSFEEWSEWKLARGDEKLLRTEAEALRVRRIDTDLYLGNARQLGEGSFAKVWTLPDYRDGSYCIKILKGGPGLTDDKTGQALYQARIQAVTNAIVEYDMLSRELEHPNILQVAEIVFNPRDVTCSIISKRCWKSLEELLDQCHHEFGSRTLTAPQVRRLMSDLFGALAYMHGMGIGHLDIKPGNILVDITKGHHEDLRNCEFRFTIADFGLARRFDLSHPDGSRDFIDCGTEIYWAPEICLGRGEIGASADIFAAGVTVVEAMDLEHIFTDFYPNNGSHAHLAYICTAHERFPSWKPWSDLVHVDVKKRPTAHAVIQRMKSMGHAQTLSSIQGSIPANDMETF